MTQFSELHIETESKGFVGDSISIDRIFDEQISVLDYRIENTKIERYIEKGLTKCLYLSILYKGEKRVVFTGSTILIKTIEKVPKANFPFTTIIKKEYKRFVFT
jgi:hypothetical protein